MNIREGDFEKTLDKCSELELYNILHILDYGRKENFSGSMKEHYGHLYARGLIISRIPGWDEYQKLEELKNKKKLQEKRIRELEKTIEQKRIVFAKQQKEINEKEMAQVFICDICGKQCANGPGLSSHQRNKHPEIFEDEQK